MQDKAFRETEPTYFTTLTLRAERIGIAITLLLAMLKNVCQKVYEELLRQLESGVDPRMAVVEFSVSISSI